MGAETAVAVAAEGEVVAVAAAHRAGGVAVVVQAGDAMMRA
ncbi:hypothetical protein [Nitrosospira sp. Nsp18]|nr:hypothetical protein [Nitrosospira sp. Nsp18]